MLPEGDRDGHDGSGGQPVPRERAAEALYMSRHTVCRLIDRAAAAGCSRDEDILLKEKPMWRFKDSPELGFIENELFRYRGKVYHSGSGNESGLRLNTAGKACV